MASRLTFNALLLTRDAKADRLTVTQLARPAVVRLLLLSKDGEAQGSRRPNVFKVLPVVNQANASATGLHAEYPRNNSDSCACLKSQHPKQKFLSL